MTEKRFTLEFIYDDCKIFRILDFKTPLDDFEILDALNKLNDENEQLKQSYYELRCRHSDLHKICIDFEEDVEHLKRENEQIKGDRDYWRTFAQSLIKENEKRCYDD